MSDTQSTRKRKAVSLKDTKILLKTQFNRRTHYQLIHKTSRGREKKNISTQKLVSKQQRQRVCVQKKKDNQCSEQKKKRAFRTNDTYFYTHFYSASVLGSSVAAAALAVIVDVACSNSQRFAFARHRRSSSRRKSLSFFRTRFL